MFKYSELEEAIGDKSLALARDCNSCSDSGFALQTKCCTYQPILANFLVGHALSINSEVLNDLNTKTVLCNELAVLPSKDYQDTFASTPQYGQSAELKCSFFKHGNCSIYQSRNSTCRNYYCLMSDAEKAHSSKKEFSLYTLELNLAQLIAIELGVDHSEVSRALLEVNQESECSGESPMGVEFYLGCYEYFISNKKRLIKECLPNNAGELAKL